MKKKHKRYIPRPTNPLPLIVVGVIAVIGSIFFLTSHAASPSVSAEAESATLTSPAVAVSDALASGGRSVQFSSSPSPTPTPTPTPTPPPPGLPSYSTVLSWVNAFASTHTGKATDINRTSSGSYYEPAAVQLRAVCGTGWTSVYPRLAWEYGGTDHAWITPLVSPLLICVHAPIRPPYTAEWSYANNLVTSVIFVAYPTQSPCGDKLLTCMQPTTSNIEILVDEAGGGATDGSAVGLVLTNSSTQLMLRLANGTVEKFWLNI